MAKPAAKLFNTISPNGLIRVIYERHPGPINCTTLQSTKDYASDASHPLHIRTQRRLQAFDPWKLHWRVQCPLDVSKKAFIRRWAAERFAKSVRGLLDGVVESKAKRKSPQDRTANGRISGNDLAGSQALDAVPGSPKAMPRAKYSGLGGALLLMLVKDSKRVLTATAAEVEESAAWAIARVKQVHAAKAVEGIRPDPRPISAPQQWIKAPRQVTADEVSRSMGRTEKSRDTLLPQPERARTLNTKAWSQSRSVHRSLPAAFPSTRG
ncbi:hypothetical protein LTR53_014809 [Teratosphaeriaceae sp. CCFEE 6253]|nr:hypothetical protein LTR53_014809 [Teratosphaeriaceae sp. CCFEE 6253]